MKCCKIYEIDKLRARNNNKDYVKYVRYYVIG